MVSDGPTRKAERIMAKVATIETLFAQLLDGDSSVIPVLEDAILEGVEDAGKAVYSLVIQKGYKRGSNVVEPSKVEARFTVVVPGKSIRIVGLAYPKGNYAQCRTVPGADHHGAYDRTFAIGDTVEYDSFNFSYHGAIKSIGAGGNVTVAHEHGSRSTRLDAAQFTSRNWDLDLAEAGRRNSEAMMYL
jgi:hypothetical protein